MTPFDPTTCKTPVQLLAARSTLTPDAVAYHFLVDGELDQMQKITYRELHDRASLIAASLGAVAAPGDRAVLLYPPGLEFIAAFFGCLYAGVLAVPTYPLIPGRSADLTMGIIADAAPTVILTCELLRGATRAIDVGFPGKQKPAVVLTDSIRGTTDPSRSALTPNPADIAMLQYTSGSTASPKGVMISHGNLIANAKAILDAIRMRHRDFVLASWVPPYHDMGLVGPIVTDMYAGATTYLMSPWDFLQRPARWLEAISSLGVNVSPSPNFGYDLAVRKTSDDQVRRLDLSPWTVAINAAEPIRYETLTRFAHKFGSAGFSIDNFSCCYGLAETTALALGGGPVEMDKRICRVDPAALEDGHIRYRDDGRVLVGAGSVAGSDGPVRVVDRETRQLCPESVVGEICLGGPSVSSGYWNRPPLTKEIMGVVLSGEQGNLMATGDLGFVHDDQLYVTGRVKDLIIVSGKNHYPQDVELTAGGAHPLVRPGCQAAFSVDRDSTEALVIVQEVVSGFDVEMVKEVVFHLRDAIFRTHGLGAKDIILVETGTVPKTSSGKIRRRECKKRYLEGSLSRVDKTI